MVFNAEGLMVTTSALCKAMDAVLAVMDTHSEVIRLAEQDVDQLVAIRKNLAEGYVRGLIVIAIHQKMLDLQMNDFFIGACDQLVNS